MNLNNLTSLMPEASSSNSKNILTSDVIITGTLKFENELIFDGRIEGEIVSEGGLTLGKNAHVEGEVKTKSCIVHGTVVGNISVTEKAELKASSQLTGDLRANRIIIEEGATFVGRSEVTPSKSVARESSSSAAAPQRSNKPAQQTQTPAAATTTAAQS
jgi:cytoskeletal protein CcmA (bactofilin family)